MQQEMNVSRPAAPKAIRNATVLLVTDREEDARSAELAIGIFGLRATVLHLTRAQLSALLTTSSEPVGRPSLPMADLIVLQFESPQNGSGALMRQLRANPLTCSIPMVALLPRTHADEFRVQDVCGANSAVLRPDDPEELEETLGQIAAYWLTTNVAAMR